MKTKDSKAYLSMLKKVRTPGLLCDECPIDCCDDRQDGANCVMDYRKVDTISRAVLLGVAVAAAAISLGILITAVLI